MNGSKDRIADALAQKKWILAEEITSIVFVERPELTSRWGEIGKKRCMEDSAYHVSYLAEAVRFESSELFVDYIAWAKILLNSLRIDEGDLKHNLELLRRVIVKQFDHDDAAEIESFLVRAEGELPKLPTEVESFLKPSAPLYDVATRWMELLQAHQTREARSLLIKTAKEGVRVPEIYQYVLTPCMQEVGRLWQKRTFNEAEEHYFAQTTETMLALLSTHFEGPRKRKAAVGFCVSNEQHEIGIRLVMDCFSMHGWDAVSFGSNVPRANVEHVLMSWKPDIVAISATMTFHLAEVKAVIESIRQANVGMQPRIMVGGRPFQICQDLWKRVGADFTAQSCAEAVVCTDV